MNDNFTGENVHVKNLSGAEYPRSDARFIEFS